MKKLYPPGLIYDWLLEPLLRNIKKKAADSIWRYHLSPCLDICAGTGVKCGLIRKMGYLSFGLDLELKMMTYASSQYPDISFICADAAAIPMKNHSFMGIIFSFSLHNKSPEFRIKMLQEAKRLLCPDGLIIFIDFEQPWNRPSRFGSILTRSIERLAGNTHYTNGRYFLRQGGLKKFLQNTGLMELERCNIKLASSSIIIA